MKTFILILFLKYGNGNALTSAEFSSLEKCEAAKTKIVEAWAANPWDKPQFTICVEK